MGLVGNVALGIKFKVVADPVDLDCFKFYFYRNVTLNTSRREISRSRAAIIYERSLEMLGVTMDDLMLGVRWNLSWSNACIWPDRCLQSTGADFDGQHDTGTFEPRTAASDTSARTMTVC